MGRRTWFKLALGVGVSAFFIWAILRHLDLSALGQALRASEPVWIAVAVASFTLGYICRILRWRSMLCGPRETPTFARCGVAFMVSMAANNVLPLRAGDALRAIAFTRWLDRRTPVLLATMIVERLFDLLCLLVILGLALWVFGPRISASEMVFASSAALLWGIAAFGLAIVLLPSVFERPIQHLSTWIFGPEAGITQGLGTLFATLKSTVQGGRMIPLTAWSLVAWSFEGGVFYAIANAVPGVTEPVSALLALPVATLSTLLPSTPGYAGTFHYFTIQALALFDTPLAIAAAYAVLVHLVLWLTATLAGGVCALIWILSKRHPGPTSPLQAKHP